MTISVPRIEADPNSGGAWDDEATGLRCRASRPSRRNVWWVEVCVPEGNAFYEHRYDSPQVQALDVVSPINFGLVDVARRIRLFGFDIDAKEDLAFVKAACARLAAQLIRTPR